jgi:error-prone DNA polymerase
MSGRQKDGRAPGSASWNAGGDGPALSRKRQPYEPDITQPLMRPDTGNVPYAELHCHSNFSFLDGASHPSSWPRRRPGWGSRRWRSPTTTGSTASSASPRRHGQWGCPPCSARRSRSPRRVGWLATRRPGDTHQVATGQVPDSHAPDPHGQHLLVLADGPTGYARLARALSLGHLAGEKGAPQFAFADSPMPWPAMVGAHRVPQGHGARGAGGRRPAPRPASCSGWSERSGATVCWSSCGTTATRSTPRATTRSPSWPARHDVGVVATNNVHYATPAQRKLATAVAAVRARRSLDDLDPWLPAAAGAHLRSGAEQARRFLRYPGVVELAAEIGRAARSTCRWSRPAAAVPVPDGTRRRASRSPRCSTCVSWWSRGARPPPLRRPPRRRTRTCRCAPAPGARSTTSSR